MKFYLYIAILAFITVSCSTTRNFSSIMEDDIYYIPDKETPALKTTEKLAGQAGETVLSGPVFSDETSRSAGSSTPPATFSRHPSRMTATYTGQLNSPDMQELAAQAANVLANNEQVNVTLYENTGYWIGGYRGPVSDLSEIQRIINMYPEGFASFSNGQEIALNLSFDSDWNVYTDNGRYWWFPSNSNINLYSSLLFGTYPKYIWTIIWNDPRFDSWAFDASFNHRFNWNLNLGWGGPGWSFGFGWNSGWYDPWYHGWYDPWYRPWYGNGYYPGWGYPHWHHPHWHYPHWGDGHYPNRPHRPAWFGQRPNYGGGVTGIRPNRPNTGQLNRPNSIRPATGSPVRPSTSGSLRPGTSARPGTSTGTVNRPGSTRPNTSGINRPTGTTRPTHTGTSMRPGTGTATPTQGVSRPATRPNTTTRPATTPNRPTTTTRPSTTTRPTPANNQYTRPAGNSNSGKVKTYNRPQNNYRPTYNNNSSTGYTPQRPSSTRSSSSTSRSSSYTPSGNSGSNYTPSRSMPSRSSGSSYSPSRSSGGSSGGGVARPTRR